MKRRAFKMKLYPGKEAEYRKRHDAIWPELQLLLKAAGIAEYSLFLDESSHELFGYMQLTDEKAVDALPGQEVMQRWWAYMKDIMDTNEDHSPISTPLTEVFYMP